MPDVRVGLTAAAGVSTSRRASVGGFIPAVARALSVVSVPAPPGAAAPRHAPGAGMGLIALKGRALPVVAAVSPFDSNELDQMQQRQMTGGRPSGLGEAFKQIREMYTKGERDSESDAAEVTKYIAGLHEAAIRKYNELAQEQGLPQLPQISEFLATVLGREGQGQGDESGIGGAMVVTEVLPAWRSDP